MMFFFFTDPATTEIYTLSLHDALPISLWLNLPVKIAIDIRRMTEFGVGTYTRDRKSTRLNSSHVAISYAVFCLKKKKTRRSFALNLRNSISCFADQPRSLCQF